MTTLVAISDTHGAHERVDVPACDVVVCAGDFTRRGTWPEIHDFLRWFSSRPAGHRVLIGGNHDGAAEREPAAIAAACAEAGITWLLDGQTEAAGLRIWGSPWTPAWRSMAFNRPRGAALAEAWAQIPPDLDVLVTHGPPRGIGDRALLGRVGCDDLRAAVLARPPRVHLFGHIHEARGRYAIPGVRTVFYNVANRGIASFGLRPATRIDLPPAAR